MDSIIGQLQQIGFSQYEAQAYIALLKESPMNGYELAKASGIPRPNIYPVLQKLEERSVIMRIDSTEGARYAPIEPRELISRLQRNYQRALESAGSALNEVAVNATIEDILNARGYPVLLEHARSVVTSANQRLLVGIWPEEAQNLSDALRQAEERGVQITTLCLKGCDHECHNCQGNIFRYPLAQSGENRWLVLIPDNKEVLAGEITPDQDALAIRTRQSMLVNLTAGYIQNSIALARILEDLGDRFELVIDRQARIALDALHPLQAQGRWLEVMQQMIHTKNHPQ